jgi:hypothetical protein
MKKYSEKRVIVECGSVKRGSLGYSLRISIPAMDIPAVMMVRYAVLDLRTIIHSLGH